MDVTDKVGGALRISPSGKSLLLALEDGTLQLRTFDGKAMSIAPHDTLRGGACCVTLELSGGYAVSSGLDGMVRMRTCLLPSFHLAPQVLSSALDTSLIRPTTHFFHRRASCCIPRSSKPLLLRQRPLRCR